MLGRTLDQAFPDSVRHTLICGKKCAPPVSLSLLLPLSLCLCLYPYASPSAWTLVTTDDPAQVAKSPKQTAVLGGARGPAALCTFWAGRGLRGDARDPWGLARWGRTWPPWQVSQLCPGLWG